MPRDSQRSKVYDAENAAFGKASKPDAGLESVDQCQAFVDRVLGTPGIVDRFSRAPVVTVKPGHGARHARFDAIGSRGSGDLIAPKWSRRKVWLLHELAHALTHREDEPWHGWRFCECYLYLVRVFAGRGCEDSLKREFKAHRVKFKRPRSSTMTDEQREAARERMAALNSAKVATT